MYLLGRVRDAIVTHVILVCELVKIRLQLLKVRYLSRGANYAGVVYFEEPLHALVALRGAV